MQLIFQDSNYTKGNDNGSFYAYGALPNDGVYINPMRTGSFSPPSPSESGESFFLHDPQEIIYNRVKDIFDSDASTKDEITNQNNVIHSLTVQAEIHSSSGAASGSEEDISVNSSRSSNLQQVSSIQKNSLVEKHTSTNSKSLINNPPTSKLEIDNHDHDYEDIYLVREEAKIAPKKLNGRSRSRDSGSHSRSASASSTRSHDVIVHMTSSVSIYIFI